MNELPLFPLSAVLMPHGRMPLQIFEQRYLDLIRDCSRNGTGFGVVWLRQGSEAMLPSGNEMELAEHGCYATIVDFDQLPNGLLGVTIEGQRRFRLGDAEVRENGLVVGQVEIEEPPEHQSMDSSWESLTEVLQGLMTHPHVERMQLQLDTDNAWQVGYLLAQLLPLEESYKYDLLCCDTLPELMEQLQDLLNDLSE